MCLRGSLFRSAGGSLLSRRTAQPGADSPAAKEDRLLESELASFGRKSVEGEEVGAGEVEEF